MKRDFRGCVSFFEVKPNCVLQSQNNKFSMNQNEVLQSTFYLNTLTKPIQVQFYETTHFWLLQFCGREKGRKKEKRSLIDGCSKAKLNENSASQFQTLPVEKKENLLQTGTNRKTVRSHVKRKLQVWVNKTPKYIFMYNTVQNSLEFPHTQQYFWRTLLLLPTWKISKRNLA